MLSESLLSSVTDAVFSFLPEHIDLTERMYTWLGQDPQRLIFQAALARAYVSFDHFHPQWTNSFFNSPFLNDCAAPLLVRCLIHGQSLTPAELATAWADYIGLPVEQHMAELISPVTDFLNTLHVEILNYTEFHMLFNSFTSETITAFTSQISIALEALFMQLTKNLSKSSKYHVNVDQTQGLTVGDSNVIFQMFVSGNAAEAMDEKEPALPPKPAIYISHCAVEDQYATGMLVAICMALNESGFDVLLDEKRQQRGDDERRQIYTRLQQCHGSIILFSEDALKSDWVVYETKLLTSRKFLEPEFVTLAILLPPLKPEDLTQNFFSTVLIKDNYQLTKEDTLNAVITNLLERFASLKNCYPDSPLQKLEGMISPRLKDLDRDILLRAAKELGINVETWSLKANYCRTLLARELLKVEFLSVSKAIEILAQQLEPEDALYILEVLSSSWVDERAAALIPEIVKRPLAQRTFCVNSNNKFTGLSYIQRACNASSGWITLMVNNVYAEDQFGSLVNELRSEFKRIFGIDDNDKIIERWLNDPEEDINPYIVLLPGNIDYDVLIQLRQKYSRVTFFLLPGYELFDINELKSKYIEFLLPELDPDQEWRAYGRYRNAYAIVNNIKRPHGGIPRVL